MSRVPWIAFALALSACASKQKVPEVPPPPPPPAVEAPAPAPPPVVRAPEQPSGPACAGDDDCSSTQLCVSGRCAAATFDLAACRPVAHFDFDRATLHPEDLPPLQRVARCLGADPSTQVTFEGHCDERGTTEYNLLLGERRARALQGYVAGLGVDKARLHAVSYGKERPLCVEHEESCWQQNRRAVTVPGEPADEPTPQAMR